MRLMNTASVVIVASVIIIVSALAQGPAVIVLAPSPSRGNRNDRKKYEFSPRVVTVKKGEHVKLVITATDRDHGFKLDAFKIDQHLKKGEPATVEFTADKVGEFPFQCSVICGIGHHKMKGKLVVQ